MGEGGLGVGAGGTPTLGVGLAAAAVPTRDPRWPSRQPTSKVDALARASLASTMASVAASTIIQTTRLTAGCHWTRRAQPPLTLTSAALRR